jgi:hypothetical protein
MDVSPPIAAAILITNNSVSKSYSARQHLLDDLPIPFNATASETSAYINHL